MLYVKERGHIDAGYHQAVLYEFVPRLWAVNTGRDENGRDDPSAWFRREYIDGLANLAAENREWLGKASEEDKAIARRAVIFTIDQDMFETDAVGASDAQAYEHFMQGMLNATPLE